MYKYLYVYIYIYVHTYYTHTHTQAAGEWGRQPLCVCVHMFVYIYVYTYIYIYIYICVIHIYIYIVCFFDFICRGEGQARRTPRPRVARPGGTAVTNTPSTAIPPQKYQRPGMRMLATREGKARINVSADKNREGVKSTHPPKPRFF